MKFKLKEMLAKFVWKIAGISPKMGNLMMDWFPESYRLAMILITIEVDQATYRKMAKMMSDADARREREVIDER